jgi:hypothetical protein
MGDVYTKIAGRLKKSRSIDIDSLHADRVGRIFLSSKAIQHDAAEPLAKDKHRCSGTPTWIRQANGLDVRILDRRLPAAPCILRRSSLEAA